MKRSIAYFKTAFIAEHIKKKGTGIYTLSVIIGTLSPVILFISRLNGSQRHVPGTLHNLYTNFIENALELFAYYMFPFLIILIASRITHIDHKNRGWLLMETLPVEKYAIYFTKFALLIIANIIAVLTFILLSVAFVFILSQMDIDSNFGILEIPYAFLFNLTCRLIVASLFLSALQYSIAVLFSNFLWPIFIGIIGFSLNTFFNEANISISWYPYNAISRTFDHPHGSDLGYILTYVDYMGSIGCILLLYIGYHWFKGKGVATLFSSKKKRLFKTIGIFVLLGGLFAYVQKPKQFSPHDRTILQGTISSKVPIGHIFVIEPFVKDTLVKIPVKEGRFRHQFQEEVTLNSYDVRFDDEHRAKVLFSTNDSVHLTVTLEGQQNKTVVTGTRLVENQMLYDQRESSLFGRSMVPYILRDSTILEGPDHFFRFLQNEWTERKFSLISYKTVDNYLPRVDYIQRQKELLFLEYYTYLNDYTKKVHFNFPDKALKIPIALQTFEKPLPYNESLLDNAFYLNYVLQQLIKDNHKEIDENTKILEGIVALQEGALKNKLMYRQLGQRIKEAVTVAEIDRLLLGYSHLITDPKLKKRIDHEAARAKRLGQGRPAPDFFMETLEGSKIKLSDLQGKYTVIDVWATWCAPCVKDAPYYEKFALKYKSDQIQFVSLSVDRDKTAWKLRAREMPKFIQQLHSVNESIFREKYSIKSIPRYMVIDPYGTIINLELPRPSKPAFEIILHKALNIS